MYNTVWAIVVPGAISVWNLIILRTFFQTLPKELEDSAFIDGANDVMVLVRIALPISKAAIATITLFYAVGHWNSWFSAVIYFSDMKKYPLQVMLRQIIIFSGLAERLAGEGDMAASLEAFREREAMPISVERIKYATLFVSLVPMMVVYPFVQKYFVRGVMIGSLKG